MLVMKKVSFILLFFVIFSMYSWGQKKSDFNIVIPDIKVEDSKYNTLEYIEARTDAHDLGFAYIDTWNGTQQITLFSSLESQFKSLLEAISATQGEARTLAVQMRVLFFSLGTKGTSEGKGTCNLRMTLYEKDDAGKYYFLNTMDTLVVSDKKQVRAATNDAIVSFIADNLSFNAEEGEEALSIDQVMDVDMYERNSIPLYTQIELPDGVYNKYNALKMLTPDNTSGIMVEKQDGDDLKEVKIPDPEKPGKYKKLKPKEVYAIVVKGIPYIAYDGRFHKAYFKDGDWRFVISQKVAGSGFSLGIGVGGGNRHAGGGVGIGIPIGGKKENIEMFIDHLRGDIFFGDRVKN